MRILITGGAGFLGSQLSAEFLSRGASVRVLDDLSTGTLSNLAPMQGRLELHRGSVRDPAAVRAALEGCDAVAHLAARVGVRLLFQDPEETFRENWEGTRVVVAEAALRRLPFLLASSSEVYAKGFERPLHEESASLEDLPQRPRFFYGRSKLMGEMLLAQAAQSERFPARAIRFFNMVGPRQSGRYGMVVPTLLQQARAGAPLTVHGDGTQSRCFASVEEVAAIVASLLPQTPGFDAVNLGNPRPVRILDLAEAIRRATGSRSSLRFVDPRGALGPGYEDFPSRIPALDRLRAIGFSPPRKTIEEMIPWLLSASAPASASASCA